MTHNLKIICMCCKSINDIIISVILSEICALITILVYHFFFAIRKYDVLKKEVSKFRENQISNINLASNSTQHVERKNTIKQVESVRSQKEYDVCIPEKESVLDEKVFESEEYFKDKVYTYYSVASKKLEEESNQQDAYYCSWVECGKKFFQFYCIKGNLQKAINNHNVLIDPFCDKTKDSVDYLMASQLEVVEYGELNENNEIIKKSIIRYI